MRTFLGVIMVLIVSGDCETVSSVLNGSVLLPCSCPERQVDKLFSWQMERPKIMVFKHDHTTSAFDDRYKGRSKIFLPEHGNNCSVLLTNVTADDQGEYRCSFYSHGLYKKFFVILNVFESYNICQTNNTSESSSECLVIGRYRDAEIQWNLDGRPLRGSPTTNVTLNDSTGLYRFTSKLITKLNWTSRLTCTVKAKGVSTNITNDCWPKLSVKEQISDKEPLSFEMRYRCFKIIPIVSVLGFFLVLWRRWKFSESMPRNDEEKLATVTAKHERRTSM